MQSDSKFKWLIWLVVILILFILGVEFFIDVPNHSMWLPIVRTVDFLLIGGYAFYLAICAYLGRNKLSRWFFDYKIDLIVFFFALVLADAPRFAAAIIMFRLLCAGILVLMSSQFGAWLIGRLNFRPSQTLALSFIIVILVGAALLTFPAATQDGQGAHFFDALFMMTSAACVSGLTVHDVGAYYSLYGQGIILLGIQVGGLGIMVMSVFFTAMVAGRLPTRMQVGIGEILDTNSTEGLKSLLKAVTGTTIIMETIGAIGFFILSPQKFDTIGERLWWSVFHAISAFCNAGISLAAHSLTQFVSNPGMTFIFMILITVGGIGFFVIADLMDKDVWKVKKPMAIWNRLHLQTKVVLVATFILDLAGMMLYLYLEYDGSLSGLNVLTKINAALFQSVSLRTAGFSVVDMGNIAAPTILFCLVWMFIGASPGSTGGGIKTTTAAVAIMGVRAMLRGRSEVEILSRRVPYSIVSRSLSIVLISGFIIIIFLMLLTGTQDLPFEKALFEVVSAFGTVGFSMNLTQELDGVGRALIMCLMYIGRIGPLTLALAIGERRMSQRYKYPVGQMAIG